MLAPTFLYSGPGTADPTKERALLGVSIPGSAWEPRNSCWQRSQLGRRQRRVLDVSPQIQARFPPMYFLVPPGSPLNGGRTDRKKLSPHVHEVKPPGPQVRLALRPICEEHRTLHQTSSKFRVSLGHLGLGRLSHLAQPCL